MNVSKRYINHKPHLCLEFNQEEQEKLNILLDTVLDYAIMHGDKCAEILMDGIALLLEGIAKTKDRNSRSVQDL